MFPLGRELKLPFPGFGTLEHWYHLLQYHEALFNLPYPKEWHMPPQFPCCNYSIADVFNRWWVPGTPPPVTGMLRSVPYFEVMAAGGVWLPEDLLHASAVATDAFTFRGPAGRPAKKHTNLFGTPAGDALRSFLRKSGRPLVWTAYSPRAEHVGGWHLGGRGGGGARAAAEAPAEERAAWEAAEGRGGGAMLLDPSVGGIAGGRITKADVDAWDAAWASAAAAPNETVLAQHVRFAKLAAAAPPYLRLTDRTWAQRHVCAEAEADPARHVLGVDGAGDCVFWVDDAPAARWEMLNDGSCEPSGSARAKFGSAAACRAASASTRWRCVRLAPPSSESMANASYCVPHEEGAHASLGGCEAGCAPPPLPPRGNCCWSAKGVPLGACDAASRMSCPAGAAGACAAGKWACEGLCKGSWCPVSE